MTYEEKLKDLRTARKTLHILEDRGILENNLSTEHITAIRIAEFALDELCKSKDVQPVKRGRWITKAENYYKAWQDSGRSWDYMPYFVTGKHIACSECFIEYDVCTEGIEHWTGCPCCLARMDGEQND
jgi:hypothetical protein